MIILEGSDCVGKTTAAKSLVGWTEARIVHAGVKPPGYDFVGQRMAELQPGFIHDRFHLSAFVYGFLLKCHDTNLTQSGMLGLMRWIRWNRVPVIILFDSDHDDYRKRILARKRVDEFDLEVCCAANRMYQFLVHQDVAGEPFCTTAWDISTMGWPTKEGILGWITMDPSL